MPVAGVPASLAVPSLRDVNVTPAGSVPLELTVAVGEPVDVTVNVNAEPWRTVTLLALVMRGKSRTFSVTA